MGDSEKGGSGTLAESHPQQAQLRLAGSGLHSQDHHTRLVPVDGEGLYKSSQPPILEAPLSSHCPNNLCFLDKGSFSVWHSIQNPRDPQQEEQAADLGTWIYPDLVLVPGHPGQVINCLRVRCIA